MVAVAAMVFAAGCGIFVVFHLCLIAGAPWGPWTMGGRWGGKLPAPARGLSVVSVVILAALAFATLSLADLTGWKMPFWVRPLALAYMGLAIVLHIVTPSARERRLWLPVILVMAAALTVVSLG